MTITQPTMTPDEFAAAQKSLGLSDAQFALVLGFENPQHVRRLRAPADASHAKRVMPATVRLIQAYLAGYRPDDWPNRDRLTAEEKERSTEILERLQNLERIVGITRTATSDHDEE